MSIHDIHLAWRLLLQTVAGIGTIRDVVSRLRAADDVNSINFITTWMRQKDRSGVSPSPQVGLHDFMTVRSLPA